MTQRRRTERSEHEYIYYPRKSQRPSVVDQLGKPFVLFLLGGMLTFGLQWAVIGNRLANVEEWVAEHKRVSVTRDDLNSVKLELKDTQKSYVTKDQFDAAFSSLQRGINDLIRRDEMRDRNSAQQRTMR